MVFNIGDSLNQLAGMGLFDYVFPFLIIFSVVFAILQKTKIFEQTGAGATTNTKPINAIIAISVGLLSLLNNYVRDFFAIIFPKFGIALAIFLVVMILVGFFYRPNAEGTISKLSWVGWVLGIGVVIWAWSEWSDMFGASNFVTFFADYFPGIILLLSLGALIYWVMK